MAMTQGSVVVGVFPALAQAQHAVDELRRAGFDDGEIGFLTRVGVENTADNDASVRLATGAVEGGIVGGVIGAAVSLLIPGFGPALAGGILAATFSGAAVGAAAGGIMNAFSNIGVSDTDARFYQSELTAGHVVITVKVSDGLEDAATILRNSGAINVKTHIGVINAPSHHLAETHDPPLDTPEDNMPLT